MARTKGSKCRKTLARELGIEIWDEGRLYSLFEELSEV